jgi:ABC-type multidrug transport system ATPase subunit
VKIELQKAGKKYFREWVFRNVDLTIEPRERVAVLGPNGSGKSTFLQLLSGALLTTEGRISHSKEDKIIDPEKVFRDMSIAAPYLELIEEFTLEEIVDFHFSFKKTNSGMSRSDIVKLTGLEASRRKVFKYFSSGMKQRVKLALALLSDVEVVLLDEPCSNLDSAAILWYKDLVKDHGQDKLIIVCSNNQANEFEFCSRHLNMMDWK